MRIVSLALVCLASFLIGSIPTAYLLVRRAHGKDLRIEGSGNIGALNAFEVSRSKRTGLQVLLIDLTKGMSAVLLTAVVTRWDFLCGAVALTSVVFGHNYSPWIGFRGGRGLAAAAGGSLVFNPLFVLLWGVGWLLTRLVAKNVHVCNIAATVAFPLAVLAFPRLAMNFSVFPVPSPTDATWAAGAISAVLLLGHSAPLRDLLRHHTPSSSELS